MQQETRRGLQQPQSERKNMTAQVMSSAEWLLRPWPHPRDRKLPDLIAMLNDPDSPWSFDLREYSRERQPQRLYSPAAFTRPWDDRILVDPDSRYFKEVFREDENPLVFKTAPLGCALPITTATAARHGL